MRMHEHRLTEEGEKNEEEAASHDEWERDRQPNVKAVGSPRRQPTQARRTLLLRRGLPRLRL